MKRISRVSACVACVGLWVAGSLPVLGAAPASPRPPAAPPASVRPAVRPPEDEWIQQAQAAYARGLVDQTITHLDRALTLNATNAQVHYFKGRVYADQRRYQDAVGSYSLALKFDPRAVGIHQRRGFEYFKLGMFREALDDFDAYIRATPSAEAHHWQRGIAYYYARLYAEGQRQFELHQTVNGNDVENAVWHFLCVARRDGLEKARAGLIPITGDRRVPMTQIHALFAGQGDTNAVWAAVAAGSPPPEERKGREFYAHLYLGLYYEALGREADALIHINKAAENFSEFDYMGEVARVHREEFKRRALRLQSRPSRPPTPAPSPAP